MLSPPIGPLTPVDPQTPVVMLLAFAALGAPFAASCAPPPRDDFAELAPIRGRLQRYDIACKESLASAGGRREENQDNG